VHAKDRTIKEFEKVNQSGLPKQTKWDNFKLDTKVQDTKRSGLS